MHGKTAAALKNKPLFADIAPAFLDFIGGAILVAHNAAFDRSFLNAELRRLKLPVILEHRRLDSLRLACLRWRRQSCGLDACCARLGIKKTAMRETHSAVNDAILCAHIYSHLRKR